MFCARSEGGFTTIELMLAVMVTTIGIIALVGTLDMSRRVTSLSEMKEAAAHIAQQNLEQLRTLSYQRASLDGTPSPASSTDPKQPAYYVSGVLAVDAAQGQVASTPTSWSDGRVSGKVHRFVTWVDDPTVAPAADCQGDDCVRDYKRVTVAVTVDNAGGPQRPIVASALVADPSVSGAANPSESPTTKCMDGDQLVDCSTTIPGKVSAFYLYDTPATQNTRQEIAGSHETHPTVAPTGSCPESGGGSTSGCPVPDLMGVTPTPTSSVTPPLYSYSTEITGGTWPGGAVIRRDTTCDGTPTTTDNTRGHLWVTAPLAAPMTLTGDASLYLSTATFNAVAAAVKICVRFYNVPGSITNLVASPPIAIGTDSHEQSTWPRTATAVGFSIDFREGQPDYTIPQGNRLGVRIWTASSAEADIAAIYDHPSHASFVQVNEAP